MNFTKRIIKNLKKFFKSKLAVLIALIGLGTFGYSKVVQADSNYVFSTVYQYYMLDNRADAFKDQGKDEKHAANMANLGSGGISGSFSYYDIVNSAPSDVKGADSTARSFVSMMATYSTFKYFSNRVQGFESIIPAISRGLTLVFLLPVALILDVLGLIIPAVIKILAKLNIISFLGAMITNQGIATDLPAKLGISKGQFKQFTDILLGILAISIIISLVLALRKGTTNVDRKYLNKFKGRLISLVALPVAVGIGASLIQDLTNLTSNIPLTQTSYSRYMIDDRSWAYNYNFAPSGNSASGSDIKPSGKGSFVDLAFDPYTENGGKRIAAINSASSLTGNGAIFPNASLALAYGTGQTFSATDYINFQGSAESLQKTNGLGGATYGSYYSYAKSWSDKKLLDVDNAYYGTGGKMNDGDQNGSYKSAVDDYKNDDKLNTAKQVAWRDRFIYGAKNSGSLDKYYGDNPSQEMIQGNVGGTGNRTVPSDQSMFLILSTIFDETGGRYYIAAPARGLKQGMAVFDSNRSDYYVVSMVGITFFTTLILIAQALLIVTVLLALIAALMSFGIIDMNVRPFKAWLKGATLGDLEYSAAFCIYAIGIAGTIVFFNLLPPIILSFVKYASQLIIGGIAKIAEMTPSTPQASMAYNSIPLILSGAVAIAFFVLWIKNKKFRNMLIDVFSFAWDWARATGDRLERQASGGSTESGMKEARKGNHVRANKCYNAVKQHAKDWFNKYGNDEDKNPKYGKDKDFENPNDSQLPPVQESEHDDDTATLPSANVPGVPSSQANKGTSTQQIKRQGQYDRIKNSLAEVQNNPHLKPNSVSDVLDVQDSVDKFKANPSQENFDNAKKHLELLKKHMKADGSSKEELEPINNAIKELDAMGKDSGLKTDKPLIKKSEHSNTPENGKQPNTNNVHTDHNSEATKGNNKSNYVDNKVSAKKSGSKANNDPIVHRHTQYTSEDITKSGKKNRKVIDVTDKSDIQKITQQDVTKPVIQHKPVRVVHDNQIKGVISALGNASQNKQVKRALKLLRNSQNQGDVKRNLRNLQKSVRTLDRATKNQINTNQLAKSLTDIAKKIIISKDGIYK